MTRRLPVVDFDDGAWGDWLNNFIIKEHVDTAGVPAVTNGGHKTITVQAGSTAAGSAPLKLTSGDLMSSPEVGAVEFLTDDLYFTQTTGTTRKKVTTYNTNTDANLTVGNTIEGYTETVTAVGTTSLAATDKYQQYFIGSTTQTVTMPQTSTLVVGQQWQIVNRSTGLVTVNSYGSNQLAVLGNGARIIATCVSISVDTAAAWSVFCGQNITVESSATFPAGPPNPSVGDLWIDTA